MSAGRIRVQPLNEYSVDWRANSIATDNAQATCTRPAVSQAAASVTGQGARNVCTGITVTIAGGSAAPSAAQLSVALIDGATGGSTYLWGPIAVGVPAIAGGLSGIVCIPMFEIGSPHTAMTLEFSGAGGSNSIESVWMSGTTV